MKRNVAVPFVLLFLASLGPLAGDVHSQDESKKPPGEGSEPKKDHGATAEVKSAGTTVKIRLKISTEGKDSLPTKSKIQWEGQGDCKSVTGSSLLGGDGTASADLPVCKVKISIFITGYDTATVTLKLAGNEKKYGDPVRITVKPHGPPKLDW